MRISVRRKLKSRIRKTKIFGYFQTATTTVAILTGILALQANQIAREALASQRVAAAWQMISLPDGAGRRYALETLVNDTNETLVGLNFGCQKPVLVENAVIECKTPRTFLDGVYLAPKTDEFGNSRRVVSLNLDLSSISNAEIRNLYLLDLSMFLTNVEETIFQNVHFKWAKIYGDSFFSREDVAANISDSIVEYSILSGSLDAWKFRNTRFSHVVFANADLTKTIFSTTSWLSGWRNVPLAGDFERPAYPDIDITGAVFCEKHSERTGWTDCSEGLDADFFRRAYYVEDDPPIGLDLLDINFDFSEIAKCTSTGYILHCKDKYAHWDIGNLRWYKNKEIVEVDGIEIERKKYDPLYNFSFSK